jgi:hypothetical protein
VSYIFVDEDEWETVTESRPCRSCGGDLWKCDGRCSGAFSVGQRRRAPEEVARIKAERRRKEEDEILARADAIRVARGLVQ